MLLGCSRELVKSSRIEIALHGLTHENESIQVVEFWSRHSASLSAAAVLAVVARCQTVSAFVFIDARVAGHINRLVSYGLMSPED